MSYTLKEDENAVWCLGNAILASLGSSKCSHLYYLKRLLIFYVNFTCRA